MDDLEIFWEGEGGALLHNTLKESEMLKHTRGLKLISDYANTVACLAYSIIVQYILND